MRKILESKKGQLGLGVAKTFVLAILILVILAVVSLIVLNNLRDTTRAEGSTDITIGGIINNTSNAMADFFTDAGTWFTLISVVVIILIIAVVIVVVNRFGGASGGGATSDFT